jgi:hypothetical protein
MTFSCTPRFQPEAGTWLGEFNQSLSLASYRLRVEFGLSKPEEVSFTNAIVNVDDP